MATKGMTYSTNRKTVQSELKSTGKNASAKNVTAEIERRQAINKTRAIKSQATIQAKKQAKIEAKKQVLANVEMAIWQNPDAISEITASSKTKDNIALRSVISSQLDENLDINTTGIKRDLINDVKAVAQHLNRQIHYDNFISISEYFDFEDERIDSNDKAFGVFYEIYSSGSRRYASVEETLLTLINHGLSTEPYRRMLQNTKPKDYSDIIKDAMSSK